MAAAPMLKMQVEVGNQATCDLLRLTRAAPTTTYRRLRRPVDGAPSGRRGQGIQAKAFPAGTDIFAPVAIQRDKTGATSSVKDLIGVHQEAITDHVRAPSGATPTTLAMVGAMDATAIAAFPSGKNGPGGPKARPILEKAFGSNWFFAKDVLISNKWPDAVPKDLPLRKDATLREDLMWRLIGLRTWEYNDIFTELRTRYQDEDKLEGKEPKDPKAILDWGSAGSDTATSDVDLNLKGERNMQAVADFNTDFLKRGWPYEAGTVYDVNAYCKDNMWDFSVVDGLMSMTSEPNAPENLPQDKKDSDQQEVAAMIKLIRFLSHGHDLPVRAWTRYKAKLTMNDQLTATIVTAEIGYRKWFTELAVEKARISTTAEKVIDATLMARDHAEKLDAAIDMRASNRLYETKIKDLIAARQELADAKAIDVDAAELLGVAQRVRQLVLEAAMFANEAMITAGASQFVVFGTQVGLKKGPDVKVTLTEGQFYHAFTEQLADTIKEFSHFERLDDGLLKGGKYLMRMTLAADQLDGVKGKQSRILNMDKLRKLGDYAMSTKNMTGTMPNKLKVMSYALRESGLPPRKERFLEIIAQFGADVTNAYQGAKGAVKVPAKPTAGDPVKKQAHADAFAKKTGAEMRIANIKGADLSAAIAALGLGVSVTAPAPTAAPATATATAPAKSPRPRAPWRP